VGKKATKKSTTSSPAAAVVKKKLPPLRLSAEEMVARAKMAETLQGWRRELDRALIAEARGWPRRLEQAKGAGSGDTQSSSSSSSQLTEDQIQTLMGDVSKLADLPKKIRRYAVLKYGAQWRDHEPAEVRKNANDDPLYRKEVGVIVHHITTFRRGLDRKK